MLNLSSIDPEQRLLLIGIPAPADVAAIAGRLERGLLVAMGTDEEVRQARREARDLDNVMFVCFSLPLPWQDGFFDAIIQSDSAEPASAELASEIDRVMRRSNEEKHG